MSPNESGMGLDTLQETANGVVKRDAPNSVEDMGRRWESQLLRDTVKSNCLRTHTKRHHEVYSRSLMRPLVALRQVQEMEKQGNFSPETNPIADDDPSQRTNLQAAELVSIRTKQQQYCRRPLPSDKKAAAVPAAAKPKFQFNKKPFEFTFPDDDGRDVTALCTAFAEHQEGAESVLRERLQAQGDLGKRTEHPATTAVTTGLDATPSSKVPSAKRPAPSQADTPETARPDRRPVARKL
mmetsp:Transcript_33598/g.82593  ORF Transcript_33598/g.82593 Transcript_33598/m.82593 type:complete len:239 (-) Transcript_33598:725-1441(-)